MSRPEQFTHAQLIDPGLMLAYQIAERSNGTDFLDAGIASRSSGSKVARLLMAGASMGLIGGLATEVVSNNAPEASADYQCAVPDYYVTEYVYDNLGNEVGSLQRGYCYDAPKPTPTTSPAPGPTPTSPPSGGNPTPAPRPTTPATTSPFSEVDEDGDSWSITIKKSTGETFSGWDIDDKSPGLGEEGLIILQSEMQLRGLDFNGITDDIKLVAQTVHPDQWSLYLSEILSVPATTTTTTTIPETSTTVPSETSTTIEELETSSTGASETSTTEKEATAAVVDTDSSDGSGNKKLLAAVLGVLGVLGLGGTVVAARRHREDESQIPPQSFGESPVAGN